jgi:hypothetical protein
MDTTIGLSLPATRMIENNRNASRISLVIIFDGISFKLVESQYKCHSSPFSFFNSSGRIHKDKKDNAGQYYRKSQFKA